MGTTKKGYRDREANLDLLGVGGDWHGRAALMTDVERGSCLHGPNSSRLSPFRRKQGQGHFQKLLCCYIYLPTWGSLQRVGSPGHALAPNICVTAIRGYTCDELLS
jgi:hypothetical protein